MQVACPTAAQGTSVFFTTNEGKVTFEPNKKLVPNSNKRGVRYRATWPKEAFDNGVDGLFRSLSECEQSNLNALTVSKRARSQTLDARLEQALTQQGGDENEEWEDFEDFIGEDASDGQTANNLSEEEMVSDQALSAQLEQALKDLAL